ncbi:hypothetical protein [Actinomadura kijaniata]|uniref:hypothetical protein n=1 Tax=Actinomadura kijaniata TaxID=46161 RepID=UPI0008328F7A|nr:hypothetical protein [Actinomadura kijaniata]
MINLRKTAPPHRADQARTGVTFVPPTGRSLTVIQPADDQTSQVADLWRLHDQAARVHRQRALAHLAFAVLVAVLGVTLAATLSLAALWELLTTLAALYGLCMAATTLWDWTTQHYQWPRTWDPTTGFGYRLTTTGYRPRRRWYAPGQTVLLTHPAADPVAVNGPDAPPDEVVHVLWWITDPAMDQPWVVIHRNTQPAQAVPLNRLAPLPVRPDRTEARR